MGISGLLAHLKNTAANTLGIYDLPEGNRRFLLMHFGFLLFTAIPGVFVNTFFFRLNHSIATVAIFNAIIVFGTALCMQVSSYISIRKSPVFVIRIGIWLFNLFYLTLLLVQGRAVLFMPLLGILEAAASGFYWQGYNIMMREFTDSRILNTTLSVVGLSGSIISLVIPLTSGLLISNIGGIFGYSLVFLLSFLFSVYTNYLSYRIPMVSITSKPHLLLTYRKIFSLRPWRAICIGDFFRGIRDTAFPLFLNLAFFKLISSEAVLGANNMACGLAAIISFALSAKIIRPSNRILCLAVSSALLFVFYLSVFLGVNAAQIFVLSIVNSLLVTFIVNPSTGELFDAFRRTGKKTNISQLMAAHEIFFAAGRVCGLMIMIALASDMTKCGWALLILNLGPLLEAAILQIARKGKRYERDSVSDRKA